MTKKMLIDATQAEETRVAIIEGNRLQAFDFDAANRKQLKGNLYLAKVTRVEPSLQACFVEYGGNRQGFLAFSEIHPDYYRIPVEDREALLAEEAAWDEDDFADEMDDQPAPARRKSARNETEQPAIAMPADDLFGNDGAVDAGINTQLQDDVHAAHADDHGVHDDAPTGGDIQQLEKDQTVETIGGENEDSYEEQEQTARRHSKLRRRYKIQEVIKRRQILLIQVTKEERGNKGAALTTYVSLPGRYCVLMPNSPRGGGISRKIANGQDRRRMRELLDELEVPAGMSVILRTAGMQRTKQEVKRDLDYLLRLWDDIRHTTMESVAPAMIYEEADIFKRAVRDLYNSDTEEILVAGSRESYLQVRDFMKMLIPSHARRVKHYQDPIVPLFPRYQVESQIDQIYSPRVDLKSGGYIIINPTEALVSIDVNSGRSTRERNIDDTALNTNLEAAEEIARQLRLRDLGGLVVIDFIDMESGRHNAKVERRLKEAMASDRARIEIGRVSPFGLLELSRQRLHPSLTETHFCACTMCNGTGLIRTTESAAVVALRMIEDEAIKGRAVQITACLPQQVAVYMLNHKRDALQRIDDYLGCRVAISIDEEMMPNDIKIDIIKGTPQPKIKPPEPIAFAEDNDTDLPVEDDIENGEPLFPHLVGADEDNVEQASYPRGERRGRGRRGRGGGRDRDRGPRNNNKDQNGDVTIIPITQGDGDMAVQPPGVDEDGNAITSPSFGRRRGGGRDRRNRFGNRRSGDKQQQNAAGIDQPMIPSDIPLNDVTGDPVADIKPAKPVFPAKQPRAAAPAPQNAPAQAVANDAKAEDPNQPKKRGWWSKLVNQESSEA